MSFFTLTAIEIGSTVISRITSQNIAPAIQKTLAKAAGLPDNTFVAVSAMAPIITFATTEVKQMLDLAGMDGLLIDESVSFNGITLWLRQRLKGGVFASDTGTSIKVFINDAMLVPASCPSAIGQDATIEMQVMPIFDGTNPPMLVTDATDFTPTFATSDPDHWTIGKSWVDGKLVDFVETININFGLGIDRRTPPGTVYPTWIGIVSRDPSIIIQTNDLKHIGTVAAGVVGGGVDLSPDNGLEGIALSGTTRVFLQKRIPGGLLVADATASHISFQVNDGHVEYQDITGQGGDHAGVGMVVTPIAPDPATDNLIVINTADAQNIS